MDANTDWIDAAIEKANDPDPAWPVIPRRYPFTYAYDFIRSHGTAVNEAATHVDVPLPDGASRSEAAGWLTIAVGEDSRHPDKVAAARRFADAYIAEHHLVWPDGIDGDSIIASRRQPDGSYNWADRP